MKSINHNKFIRKGVFALVAVCVLMPLTALAQSGRPYKLTWTTIDGGGGTSSGGDFALVGTIGQPDAGVMSGGDFELLGGFWPGGPPVCDCLGDLTAPAGQVDLWDLDAMVNMLVAAGPPFIVHVEGGHCGDMAAPMGQVDLQDLDALVNLLVGAGPPFIVPCE